MSDLRDLTRSRLVQVLSAIAAGLALTVLAPAVLSAVGLSSPPVGCASSPEGCEPDTTIPRITIRTPVDEVEVDRDGVLIADYSCTDGLRGSGVASCVGTVPDGQPVDTSRAGRWSFKVDATDNAGNHQRKVVHYRVRETDVTAPTVDLRTPTEGQQVLRGETLIADFSCADEPGGSGITSCTGTKADGATISTTSPGEKTFTVTARDRAGHRTTVTVHYTVLETDGEAPTVDLRSPTQGQEIAVGAVVVADYSCADEEGGSGIKTCTGTRSDGSAINTSSIGTKTFTVTATDNAGHQTTTSVTYTVVDVAAPTITISKPADGFQYATGSLIWVSFHCTDETGGSGIASCVGTQDNSDPLDIRPGSHTFTVTATDKAGHQASRTVTYTSVDTTAPTIAFTKPSANQKITVGANVIADYACNEEYFGSGVASCVGSVPDGTALDTSTRGTFTFSVTATDNAGNQRTASVTYTVRETVQPTVSPTTPGLFARSFPQNGVVLADYSCLDNAGGSGIASCVGSVPDGQPIDTSTMGNHTFTIVATDNDGNSRSQNIVYTVLEGVAPTITITSPTEGQEIAWNSDDVMVQFTCVDNEGGSGMASCSGTSSSGFPVHTTHIGPQAITVTARDVAGTTAQATVHFTVVDRTAPRLHVATPSDGQVIQLGSLVTASYGCGESSLESGVASCEGTVPDGFAIDTLTVGEHVFRLDAADNAGNTSSTTSRYTVVDGTEPVATISAPTDGQEIARDASVVADFHCVDDVAIATCAGTVADGQTIDTSTLGDHTFAVTATDTSGNDSTSTVHYTVVDVTDPTASITSPTPGQAVAQGATVAADFSCTDDVAVATCEGTVADGQPIDTSTLGTHTFSVTATDTAGNDTTVSTAYSVVDVTDPEVTISSPTADQVVEQGAELLADFACTDDTTVATCTGDVEDGEALDTSTPGDLTFSVTATDTAGNHVTETVGYTVEHHRPDGLARQGSGAMVGGDRYNTTGAGQTVSATVRRGRTLVFSLRFENDGSVADQFLVRSQGAAAGMTPTFRSGNRDATAAVRSGSHRTNVVGAGRSVALQLSVRVGAGVPVGRTLDLGVTVRSVSHPEVTDVVRLKARVIR